MSGLSQHGSSLLGSLQYSSTQLHLICLPALTLLKLITSPTPNVTLLFFWGQTPPTPPQPPFYHTTHKISENKCMVSILLIKNVSLFRQVELTILKLPQLPYGARYLCVFGESAPILAKPSRNGLSCLTPVLPARPRIESGKGE